MEITDQSFNIVDIKPANMEELTEVITASEFHPKECNHFVYSSSKGTIRLCDMRQAALCDTHAKRKCSASTQWPEWKFRKEKNAIFWGSLAVFDTTSNVQNHNVFDVFFPPNCEKAHFQKTLIFSFLRLDHSCNNHLLLHCVFSSCM